MEPKFQSSFIPKGPAARSGTGDKIRSKSKGLFGLIAIAVFTLSVIAAIGVFGYNYYLKYRIGQMGKELEAARGNLKPETIEEITKLDTRIKSAKTLLAQHNSITPFFKYLEDSTVQSVRFTEMLFDTNESGQPEVTLKGQAQGYSAVALQSQIFDESGNFIDPVFSNLELDKDGKVLFVFKSVIKPELLSYEGSIEQVAPSLQPAATSTPAVEPLPTASTTASTTEETQ